MPVINLQSTDTNVGNVLYWLAAMDSAVITSASATQIVMEDGNRFYTLSGSGFATTVIGGVEYINAGTVDTIDLIISGSASYQVAQLALSGATLGAALLADTEGTDVAALETLFTSLNYVVNGTNGIDFHTVGSATSADGQSLQMTGSIDYYLGNGADVVDDAGSNNDAIFGGAGTDMLRGNDGQDTLDGGADADSLFGGAGEDQLIGDTGTDTLDGGTENDDLFGGDEADSLSGGGGDDNLTGGLGADVLVGGAGTQDFAVYNEAVYGGLVINLANAALNTGAAAGDTYSGIEGVIGGVGDDTITGDAGDNILLGVSGNDSIGGGGGNDTIIANASLSTMDGGTGIDTLESRGVAYASSDVIDLLSGASVLASISLSWTGFETYVNASTGATSAEQVLGTDGGNRLDFTVLGSGSTITAAGRGGNDTILGSAGSDTLDGGAGNDLIEGRDGDDRFANTGDGALADDTLDGGAGNDTFVLDPLSFAGNLRGGSGTRDLIEGSALAGIGLSVNLALGTHTEGSFTRDATGIEDVQGGSGNDTVRGSSYANKLWGGDGRDSLTGASGNDSLNGGEGDDWLDGGSNEDRMSGGSGIDQMSGGAGNDQLFGDADNDVLQGGAGADILDGGSGTADAASYAGAATGVRAELANAAVNTGDAAGDSFSGIENLTGSSHNDTLAGDSGGNALSGGGGDDQLRGGGGTDVLNGGAGADNLWGGAGADVHVGGSGAGIDLARYDEVNQGNLTIRLDQPAQNTGAAAGDTYLGIEGLVGGAGNDVIAGNSLDNVLVGRGGNDSLLGNAGKDTLDGQIGADTLVGGAGNDVLTGGAGADDFLFSTTLGAANVDSITDFVAGANDLVLSTAIFSAIGATLTAAEFRIGAAVDANDHILYNSATGALVYDVNGAAAGGATQFATLASGLALTAADFVML